MNAHDYPRAYEALLATIKLVPGHYPARLDLARLLLAVRKFDEAREHAQRLWT